MRDIWWSQEMTLCWRVMLQMMQQATKVIPYWTHRESYLQMITFKGTALTAQWFTEVRRKCIWRKVGVTESSCDGSARNDVPHTRYSLHVTSAATRHRHLCGTTPRARTQKWSVENPFLQAASWKHCKTAKWWRARIVLNWSAFWMSLRATAKTPSFQ